MWGFISDFVCRVGYSEARFTVAMLLQAKPDRQTFFCLQATKVCCSQLPMLTPKQFLKVMFKRLWDLYLVFIKCCKVSLNIKGVCQSSFTVWHSRCPFSSAGGWFQHSMAVVICLQGLPGVVGTMDFYGLTIPARGVHIVVGELGEAFILLPPMQMQGLVSCMEMV